MCARMAAACSQQARGKDKENEKDKDGDDSDGSSEEEEDMTDAAKLCSVINSAEAEETGLKVPFNVKIGALRQMSAEYITNNDWESLGEILRPASGSLTFTISACDEAHRAEAWRAPPSRSVRPRPLRGVCAPRRGVARLVRRAARRGPEGFRGVSARGEARRAEAWRARSAEPLSAVPRPARRGVSRSVRRAARCGTTVLRASLRFFARCQDGFQPQATC